MYILRMSIASIVLLIFEMLRQIHIIQLNSYNLDQQLLWYKKNMKSFILNLILLIAVILRYEFNFYIIDILLIIILLCIFIETFPRKQKKKLVFTSRIKRLIAMCFVLFSLFFLPLFFNKSIDNIKYLMYAVAFCDVVVFISYLIMLPVENAIRNSFINKAKKILKDSNNLFVVGITGSFGKTSVKYYLNRLLSIKYNVCMTAGSYNTPMGATLTIRNNLRSFDDIFICEMGARRVGDIAEMCDIVEPSGAIITDVGKMHLDTFKNIDNVLKCKFELVDNVYKKVANKKIVFVNGDNELIKSKIKEYKFSDSEIFTYGFNEDNDFYIPYIKTSSSGTTFKVFSKKGIDNSFETKLLGKYNIMNLTCAIGYAYMMGVDIEKISQEVKNIEGVPHRLELRANDKNNLIIDDAYNSNPNGARNAIDTLTGFDGYKKVVITPGIVELSEIQYDENLKLAEYAASKIDFALIVGKTNRDALLNGFKCNMSNENILTFDKVEEAIFYARNEIKHKKVILLLNDLTDNY